MGPVSRHAAVAGVTALAIVGCNVIFGMDAGEPFPSDAGITGMAGAGGAPGCEHCPGVDTDCRVRACDEQTCWFEDVTAATACGSNSEHKCDGIGNCVQCLTPADCTPPDSCVANQCVDQSCLNLQLDAGETDIDCGGGLCPPCPNGKVCEIANDCESLFCDIPGGKLCAACQSGADCAGAAKTYCAASGNCEAKKVPGDLCTGAVQCLSGFCPADDGICCDLPCDVTCRACLKHKTGYTNGACQPTKAYKDYDGDCSATEACDGKGACKNRNGVGCTAAGECISNNCPSQDAVCCNNPCDGECMACVSQHTGGPDGICNAILAGTDPDDECPNGNCDGTGNCDTSRRQPD